MTTRAAARYAPAAALAVAVLITWEALVRLLHVPEIILPPPSEIAAALLDPRINWPYHIGVTATKIFFRICSCGRPWLGSGRFDCHVTVASSRVDAVDTPRSDCSEDRVCSHHVPGLRLQLAADRTYHISCGLLPDSRRHSHWAFVARSAYARPSLLVSRRPLGYPLESAVSHRVALHIQWTKVSATLAVVGVNVAEFVSSRAGLGFLIINAQVSFNAPLAFAAASYLILLGVPFYALIAVVERWAMPWAVAHRAG